MNPDVSVIIVSYNTRELTIQCIESVIKETSKYSYEIIVLDNQSTDDSATAIRNIYPNVILIEPKLNLGFAAGNNKASKCAKGEYLLLLNPDTIILDGAIDNLIDHAKQNANSKVWGGKAIFPDGSINATCWNDMTVWSTICKAIGLTYLFPKSRFFNPETIHAWDELDDVKYVDIVVGCFLLIKLNFWNKINGFNPTFFMYGDEVDLSIRARKNGAHPSITPKAKIIHYGGGSEPSSEEKLIKILKGRMSIMRIHWSPTKAFIGEYVMIIAVFFRAIASKIVHPPATQGSGLDGKVNIWGGAFRRRREWLSGWHKV
jgi:GT2 family glycosyltransferase